MRKRKELKETGQIGGVVVDRKGKLVEGDTEE